LRDLQNSSGIQLRVNVIDKQRFRF
jgi:hypothetical protein